MNATRINLFTVYTLSTISYSSLNRKTHSLNLKIVQENIKKIVQQHRAN